MCWPCHHSGFKSSGLETQFRELSGQLVWDVPSFGPEPGPSEIVEVVLERDSPDNLSELEICCILKPSGLGSDAKSKMQ